MIKIDNYFKFKKNDIVVVGCSTGPDSMALIDMLLKIREKYNLSLIVAHVNHNLREQSVEEALYMKDYCLKNNILFETMTIESYGDDNFHNEAHNIRYKYFESLVNKYNANYLMTAHHGDDLVETVMMRIVRGSNLNGYSGFKEIVDKGSYKIVRPLIRFTKEELKQYDIDNNIKYYVDESNEKDKYTRNRYRKYLLPFLKEEEKNVHLKFLKFSNTLDEVSKYLDKEINKAINRTIVDNKIVIDKFVEEESFIQKEILYYLLNEYYNDELILINDRHINLILNLINGRKSNGYINLPNDVIALKAYNYLELQKSTDLISSYEVELNNYVSLPNNHIIEKIDDTNNNSNNICRLSSSDVILPLIVRTRRLGDKMVIKGINKTKKVKDIYINSKIPIRLRDSWPIVTDSTGKIVWIPGIKKSIFDKNKDDNYDIILKYS